MSGVLFSRCLSALALLLCLALLACSGAALDGPALQPADASALPSPEALSALRGGSAESQLSGAEFIAQSRCFTEDGSLRLNVSVEAVQRSGKELGWAAYRFSGLSGLPQSLEVSCGLPLPGSQWFLAVASSKDGRWHSFGPFSTETATLDMAQLPGALSESGDLQFCVLARGHNVVLHHASRLVYASPEVD